jgi:hypothetical protein
LLRLEQTTRLQRLVQRLQLVRPGRPPAGSAADDPRRRPARAGCCCCCTSDCQARARCTRDAAERRAACSSARAPVSICTRRLQVKQVKGVLLELERLPGPHLLAQLARKQLSAGRAGAALRGAESTCCCCADSRASPRGGAAGPLSLGAVLFSFAAEQDCLHLLHLLHSLAARASSSCCCCRSCCRICCRRIPQ